MKLVSTQACLQVDWASLSSIHDARGIYMILTGLTRLVDGGLTTSYNLSFTGGSKTSTYAISGIALVRMA